MAFQLCVECHFICFLFCLSYGYCCVCRCWGHPPPYFQVSQLNFQNECAIRINKYIFCSTAKFPLSYCPKWFFLRIRVFSFLSHSFECLSLLSFSLFAPCSCLSLYIGVCQGVSRRSLMYFYMMLYNGKLQLCLWNYRRFLRTWNSLFILMNGCAILQLFIVSI